MNPNETTPVGRVTPCAPQTSPTNDGEGRARLSERAALTNFTDSARGATRPTNDRRRFLKLAGATLLAGAALPKAAQAGHTGGVNISDGTSIIYFGGVVTSAAAPGVILNVYLAVDRTARAWAR